MDQVYSWIRTSIPLVLAYVFTQLDEWGIALGEEEQTTVTNAIAFVAAMAVYVVFRLLEQRFPILGKWLKIKTPVYVQPENVKTAQTLVQKEKL